MPRRDEWEITDLRMTLQCPKGHELRINHVQNIPLIDPPTLSAMSVQRKTVNQRSGLYPTNSVLAEEMPKEPKDGSHKLRPDVAETAYRTTLEATGQAPKTRPGAREKNPHAV
jgi:hypothetical protein